MISSEGALLGEEAARRLAQIGCFPIGPGLTDTEFARIEHDYDFEFADDHRAFLTAGLPLNIPAEKGQTWRKPWPDWRHGDPDELHRQLGRPVEGALFDVEHGLWLPAWGQRPADTSKALATARRHLAQAPKMIPICGHRYLPAGHGTHGHHPVLSIHQTDIIIYGTDLADYINNDFSGSGWFISADWTPPTMVPFWSDFL